MPSKSTRVNGQAARSLSAQLFTDVMTDFGARVHGSAPPNHQMHPCNRPRLEGPCPHDCRCLTEAYARSLIGGIVAFYLDEFGLGSRQEAKRLLLSTADAVSESLTSGDPAEQGASR